ncbi:MAG: YbaB/EbfC family nucleoid-associated protein [Oscillospiraceae bacterium]|nr:YbaB/EbfC family nucleoid-associated protein [Oscillospiraceae bacterium]
MKKRGMPGGMGGGNMMKQIQKMQADMIKAQEELEERVYTASAGGGAVKATVNGKHEITSLEISPDAVDPEDVEMLSDMIMAACNEALREADEIAAGEMGRFTGGLGIPGF